MGLVNCVVPQEQLEAEGLQWAREILEKSPIAIRCLKAAFNADCDGQAGLQLQLHVCILPSLMPKCKAACISLLWAQEQQ